jgi:serine/threonine-protein kinase
VDAEVWGRARALFHAALDWPQDEVERRLAEQAAGDARLLELVSDLLRRHARGGALRTGGGLAALEAQEPALPPDARLGPYRVEREVGRGGMGAVYLARRDDGRFEQRVAIKVLKRGLDSDELVARFETERRILAGLTHPHIARLLDGGSTPAGRPYFVMEYVDGRPLGQYAAEQRLGLEARLRLFLAVCAAVDHAHRSLVVHRDLKPANILVGADGAPKLLDFGIAKLLDPDAAPAATAADLRPMTPDYASPEQRAGRPVTTATDVWGLGLVLFELLTGVNPQAAGEWRDPPRASLAPRAATPAGLPESARLSRLLRGDLDAILAKALEPEPERRYRSAAALADDVERHLARRPVAARRWTAGYRLTRFVCRQRLASAALLALVVAVGVVVWQVWAVARARDRSEAQRRRAQALAVFLTDVFAVSDPSRSRGETITARELLDRGAERLKRGEARAGLESEPQTRADLLHAIGDVYEKLGLVEPAEAAFARALELRRPLPGPEAALDTAATLTRLGHLATARSDFAAAERAFREGLELRRRHAGDG